MAMIDTIYALTTPLGRSGVAVIRLSGSASLSVLQAITRRDVFNVRQAYLCNIYDPRESLNDDCRNPSGRSLIDQALVLYFQGPASFTGEDVVEIQPHGSPAVIKVLMAALDSFEGVRLADPGEFTRRAFENNKMDLTEAEAVADLIHAETQLQRTQALSQMNGSLSSLYEGWSDMLKRSLAHVEADLEFPDEDMPDGILPTLRPKLAELMAKMRDHLDDNRRGEILRDGIHIAVVGAPNAGKSSLINYLASRDVAIVSDIAGTTRDVIEAHLDISGYPVILADTAGLRPEQISGSVNDHDILEYEGIKRALSRAKSADIKMVVFDGSDDVLHQDSLKLCDENSIAVVNKSDLLSESARLVFDRDLNSDAIYISASHGTGISDLLTHVQQRLVQLIGLREAPSLTQKRHRTSLESALSHVEMACRDDVLPELVAEDLRLSVRFIGRITGRVDVEDLLDVIFRDFCIGK